MAPLASMDQKSFNSGLANLKPKYLANKGGYIFAETWGGNIADSEKAAKTPALAPQSLISEKPGTNYGRKLRSESMNKEMTEHVPRRESALALMAPPAKKRGNSIDLRGLEHAKF